ncbi:MULTISPECIES: hypothetical protein [Kitasatospora]|uniref:Uncharacterized protein n=1 Tax=Kitasatospora setae (strain ATCC 33774 / DSM 43861 / JCM 3304 / KCC A-0304 / NBRC 14216 / KM-6054) TaxID=452652 RepID=E4NB76_KITSK|nr:MULTISPECIES: hypothetical protein [Kitasatospora]BAJ28457.1 hypothetical protein KSE_26450 [Kitasatospora setae KM-6054]
MPEQELSDVFVRAVGDSAPDLGLLVAGATAEGRAIRLRRRFALGGAVAVVAVLAVGGGLLLRPAAPGRPGVTAAGPGAPAAVPAASTGPTGPTGPARPALLDALLAHLPAELLLDDWSEDGSGPDGPPESSVRARFHRASGTDAGTIEVRLLRPAELPTGQGWERDCDDRAATEVCAPVTEQDVSGVILALPGKDDQVVYRADLADRHGARIVLTATGPDGHGAPPLERDALHKIAVSLCTLPPTEEDRARARARKQAAEATAVPSSAHPSPALTLPPGTTASGVGPGGGAGR